MQLKTIHWKIRRHLGLKTDVQALRALFPTKSVLTTADIRKLLDELSDAQGLQSVFDSPTARQYAGVQAPNARSALQQLLTGGGRSRALLLYAAARLSKPQIVIETGCFTGWDSALLLAALERNEAGHLYTIDLPAKEGRFSQTGVRSGLPPGAGTGFLVPKHLKRFWTLIRGDARNELLPLLARTAKVDFFFHDSHHSYSHMMWEYTSVWPFLSDQGLLVSDDISWNTAFWDFARGVGARFVTHRANPNFGALVRSQASMHTPEDE